MLTLRLRERERAGEEVRPSGLELNGSRSLSGVGAGVTNGQAF